MIPEKMKETHKKIDVLNNLFYSIDVTINKFFDVIYWDSLSQRGLCISTTHTSQHGIAKQNGAGNLLFDTFASKSLCDKVAQDAN